MERLFRLRGGIGPAYPSIVASGSNACVLHYIENNRQMQDNELLLIDAGCAYGYYNADTRTFPVGGSTPEQRLCMRLFVSSKQHATSNRQSLQLYSRQPFA